MAFSVLCEGGARDDCDSASLSSVLSKLFRCHIELFNRRKDVECAVWFYGWQAHVGESVVYVIAALYIVLFISAGVSGHSLSAEIAACWDSEPCANCVVGVHFDGLCCPFGLARIENQCAIQSLNVIWIGRE